MLRDDQSGEVRRGAVAADAQPFSLQLLEPGHTAAAEDRRVIIALHAGDQRQVEAGEVRLHHLTDAHDRRITSGQSLNRQLPAAQEDRIDVKSILFE